MAPGLDLETKEKLDKAAVQAIVFSAGLTSEKVALTRMEMALRIWLKTWTRPGVTCPVVTRHHGIDHLL
jgi:hypothetical protein